MKVSPNGWVWVQADWVPENFNLLIKPLPWDTLLQGPSNAGPHAYSFGTPINLLPNRFVELKIYLASLTDSTNISVISDTSFYVKKDSIIGTSQKRDLPDFTLTINKPKEQENETNME